MLLTGSAAACSPALEDEPEVPALPDYIEGYGPIEDAGYNLPPIPAKYTQGVNRRLSGIYLGEAPPNSLDVDPYAKFL